MLAPLYCGATLSDTLNGAYVEIEDTTIAMYEEAYLYASELHREEV